MDNTTDVGDLIVTLLSFCYSDEHRPSLEVFASEQGITFEQVVSASLAELLAQRYMIIDKDVPGIPKPGRPLEAVKTLYSPQPTNPFHLFISYRHNDSLPYVERIFDTFKVEFGGNIFKDKTSMPIGEDYRSALNRILSSCYAVIVIIGPEWVTGTGVNGQNRLFEPHDPVCTEIEIAIKKGLPIIPVLIADAKQPQPELLPETIRPLSYFQMLSVRSDPDYGNDVDRLIDECRSFCRNDSRFSSLPIPRLPSDARLPVRVLAGSAFYLRSILIAIGEGMAVQEALFQDKQLLLSCERVIDQWCRHFGIPENDDVPNFINGQSPSIKSIDFPG